jgi:cob(I)alamin adenosyltransferase
MKTKQRTGLVILYTGLGKGKSTAAYGLLLRAWGRQMRVAALQFIKQEGARYGEVQAAEKLGIEWLATGDGFTWTSKDIDETIARAQHGWQLAQARIVSGAYDLLLLDEFTYLLHYHWLDTAAVIAWLKAYKPPALHLIITGRYAPDALIEYADLVTEMSEIKHPFKERNLPAQPGIEY